MISAEKPKDKPQYPIVSEIEDSFKKDCHKMIIDTTTDILKVIKNELK